MSLGKNDLAVRSYLYAPADRPEVVAKALTSGAHVVIADLEDGLRDGDPVAARLSLSQFLDNRTADEPGAAALHVRVNRNVSGSGWDAEDLAVAVHPAVTGIRLPKAESSAAIAELGRHLTRLESEAGMAVGSLRVYPLIESALGVVNAVQLAAAPRVQTLCLGGADLSADLGINAQGSKGSASPLDYARSVLLLAARAAGRIGPIETVTTNIDDLSLVVSHAQEARRLGFSGKSLIHPKQLSAIHKAFVPSEGEAEEARVIVAAWQSANAAGLHTATVNGKFIDAPVAARAIQIIEEYQLHG